MTDKNSNMATSGPDALLEPIQHSVLGLALAASAIIHLVLIVGTSFGLYRDWGEYGLRSDDLGFHTPAKINLIKNRQQREAEEEERRLASERRAAEAAAASEKTGSAAEAATAAPTDSGNAVTAPEVEPLPPKADFTFGDDLTLD